jgi:hypothetical protein
MRPDLFTVLRLLLGIVELKSITAAPDATYDALDRLGRASRLELERDGSARSSVLVTLVESAAEPNRVPA